MERQWPGLPRQHSGIGWRVMELLIQLGVGIAETMSRVRMCQERLWGEWFGLLRLSRQHGDVRERQNGLKML